MAVISIPGAKSQALPDLIIDTTMQFDVLRGGVKIEPVPSGNRLYQNRSYLMAVAGAQYRRDDASTVQRSDRMRTWGNTSDPRRGSHRRDSGERLCVVRHFSQQRWRWHVSGQDNCGR